MKSVVLNVLYAVGEGDADKLSRTVKSTVCDGLDAVGNDKFTSLVTERISDQNSFVFVVQHSVFVARVILVFKVDAD